MPCDETLVERVRAILAVQPGISEKRMFGGVCFLVNGNMACGVAGEELMLRLGNELTAEALEEPHTRPMDFTGKVIRSMLFVDAAGLETEAELTGWVQRAASFAAGLPAK
ncbi:TfoX/Sxy family protein [bacterium]|nr:TfoX/Sxy family protein [bacterium]